MPKRTWTLIAAIVGIVILAVFIYFVVANFGGASAQLRELERHAQDWYGQGASHYRHQVTIGCFCPFFERMPVTVEVRDGSIVSAVDNQGQEVPPDDVLRTMGDDLLTIEGVFAYARRAIREADKVEITFDPQLGYPTSLKVDWIELAMDDEMAVQITGLEILP